MSRNRVRTDLTSQSECIEPVEKAQHVRLLMMKARAALDPQCFRAFRVPERVPSKQRNMALPT